MRMRLCDTISSCGCMLMMVVLANPATAATDRNECPSRSIESRLGSIEYRLDDIQQIVSTLDNPLVEDNCVVYLSSYCFDDSIREGYVKTSTASSDVITSDRGVTLAELDAVTCSTRNKQAFDTFGSSDDREQMLETLESATAGTIIAGVTQDSPEYYDGEPFQKSAGPFFTRYNMNLTGLQVRDKFAFIMQKGYPKKTVFERRPRYGDYLKITILLSGSSIHNMTFSRV